MFCCGNEGNSERPLNKELMKVHIVLPYNIRRMQRVKGNTSCVCSKTLVSTLSDVEVFQ